MGLLTPAKVFFSNEKGRDRLADPALEARSNVG